MTMSKSEVKQLQRALRETVASSITVDGVWGKQSEDAVALFAHTTGTDNTGALTLLHKYADVRYVSDDAFAEAATKLQVPQSYVRAVAQVETNGESFLKDGRVKILFERHWFYKKLKEAATNSSDVRARMANKLKVIVPVGKDAVDTLMTLMVTKFGAICNTATGGYLGNEKEWDRLNEAMDFDVEAAAQSASYGGYQLMGFNCRPCGYPSAKDMMFALAASESAQFLAMINFIKADAGMHAALKKGDWADFAKRYNGPSYAANKYDTKLAAAEKTWQSENVGASTVLIAQA